MAKSTKINRLSVLYKSIDQTQLSEQAKTVLNKLRLATGNFTSKDEESNKAFETFYNKLLEKKPLAIRTSKEYKDHVRAKKAEIARKAREARKSKEESRQGQGSEKDANRPAKPYGWRLRGKHNYRKPTREQIRNGEAYYEGRVNRADVKRRKFPMLERGGDIEIFIPHKVANDLLKMSYSALIDLGNKDFSEIVKSDSLQTRLAEKFQKAGIDSMFTSLKRSQRSEVSDMLLKMDDELLNNYFALRGYLGEARYDLYVSEFKKYGTFLDPKNIERVQIMAKGGEVFYKESHKLGM
jgi:hypothetical protein